MKAISLWQPWATLIAIGAKQIETRHWQPPAALMGQRIAIHAAKRWTDAEKILSRQQPFRTVLRDAALMGDERGENGLPRMFYRLPLGAIVATAELVACKPSESVFSAPHPEDADSGWYPQGHKIYAYPYEFAFGDLSAGRYAWLLDDIKALPEPLPWRGGQRIFEVDLPGLET